MSGVRDTVAAVSPSINLEFRVLSTAIRESLLRERLMATLSTAFGVLAALLAAIGLYGVMSYAVARRANEIGIRLAIGAARGDVLRMVLREAAILTGAGLILGSILAVLAGSAARTLLFGLRPDDPTTIGIAVAILGSIGLVAGFVPARQHLVWIRASPCVTSNLRRWSHSSSVLPADPVPARPPSSGASWTARVGSGDRARSRSLLPRS